MLYFALPTMASVQIKDTIFFNDASFRSTYGNTNYYGTFLIKGIWADNKKLNKDILIEEVFCQNYNKECISSSSIFSSFGYVDTSINIYSIIDRNKHKYKLYSSTAGYTIEVDLQNKTASKYKVFENGDVNKYYFISDINKANNYIKSLFN